MRSSLITLALGSSLILALVSCKDDSPKLDSATEQASLELNEIINTLLPQLKDEDLTPEEKSDMEEVEDLMKQFRETNDVNIASTKTRVTLLHLAAAYKKEELIRCLLLDGANPNAQRIIMIEGKPAPGDTVLTYAVAAGFLDPETYDPKQVLRVVHQLIAKGADMGKRGPYGLLPVEIAALTGEHEDLILALVKLTPKEAIAPPLSKENRGAIIYLAAAAPFNKVLEELIKLGHHPDTQIAEGRSMLTQAVRSSLYSADDAWKKTVDLLLKHGADINHKDNQGRTALFELAFAAQQQTADENIEMDMASRIIFLLERGARTDIAIEQDEEYPGFTAFDLLSLRPDLLEELAKRKHELKAPPLSLPEEDTAMLATLCRATVTGRDTSALKDDYDRIASILLTPSEAMLHHELYEPALKSSLTILFQLDAKRAGDILYMLPIWTDELQGSDHLHCTSCSSCGGESHILRPILEAIAGQKDIIIPSAKLLHLATSLIDAGQDALAIDCLQLLSRCPDFQQVTDELLKSENISLRLGALYAQSHALDIPLPEERAVQAWLAEHSRVANTEFLREAMLLTSLEELWFGDMPDTEKAQLLAIMEEIGAQNAAEQYRRIIPMLDNPEELDHIMAGDLEWEMQLKESIARFFIKNAEQFKKG